MSEIWVSKGQGRATGGTKLERRQISLTLLGTFYLPLESPETQNPWLPFFSSYPICYHIFCIYLFPLIFFLILFIHLFLAVLGLRFCARAFSSCGERGPPFIAVHGPLTIAASLVAEHRLQTRRLSSCGSRAQSLRGTRDPSRPGLEPTSPALAGRLSTTAPPGKPSFNFLFIPQSDEPMPLK